MVRMIDANRLKDAIYTDFWEHFTQCHDSDQTALIDMVMDDIDEMPTLAPPNEWVSVEDALPPNMDDVLVVVQNNGECWTVTGYYSNTSNVWYAMLNGQDTQMDVLWWMPFPEPPTKET